jgi:hypothetical protein
VTDRELLELAARAARISLHVWGTKGAENFADMDAAPYGKLWNPLTDDGDALRLAVKLRINIEHSGLMQGGIKGADRVQASPRGMGHLACVEMYKDDALAAARRAIVEAAAEIGKAQP